MLAQHLVDVFSFVVERDIHAGLLHDFDFFRRTRGANYLDMGGEELCVLNDEPRRMQ